MLEPADIPVESSVSVVGNVVENTESRFGVEVVATRVTVLERASVPLPIDSSDKSNTQIDKRLDHRYLDTRNPAQQRILLFVHESFGWRVSFLSVMDSLTLTHLN